MMTKQTLPALPTEDGLSGYLAEIRKFPILPAEEEYCLAKRFQEHGDTEAAHKLVTSHLRLVAKIAFGYRGYGLPVSDLISEGTLGLMKAVKKFEPDKGFRLATYAMWWIKASVTEYILQSWSLVKLGTVAAQKKLFFSLNRLKTQLGVKDGQMLSDGQAQELAGQLGLPHGEVVNMDQRLSARDLSLNTPMPNDEGTEYMDLLPDETPTPEAIFADREETAMRLGMLKEAMDTLSDRERYILTQRRLVDEPVKLEDLGKEYGISRERVRQLEVRAFDKVKKAILAMTPQPAPAFA